MLLDYFIKTLFFFWNLCYTTRFHIPEYRIAGTTICHFQNLKPCVAFRNMRGLMFSQRYSRGYRSSGM